MPIFVYLKTTTGMHCGTLSLPRVLDYGRSCDSTIPVPYGYLPVIGRFSLYSHGRFYVNYEETLLDKNELCHVFDGEKFTDEPFKPDSTEECIVMISINQLNEILGLEIKIGEGWKWNPETLENNFCEGPDNDHKWNPFSKTWEKVCDECSELLHRNQYYDLLHYMTDDYLFRFTEVKFCQCDRCHKCKRFQYYDPYNHEDCKFCP